MNWPVRHAAPSDPPLQIGRAVLQQEGHALLGLAARLDESFSRAVAMLLACRGNVIVSGMGKAGLIGQKIAATLASTGTRSHFLHPAEGVHGDLGRIHADDCVLLLSQSGETEEILRLLPTLSELGVTQIAITGGRRSRLARQVQLTLWLGQLEEAGPLRLAPSTSTTAMLALGDALALAVCQERGFTPRDFARFHPGGSLGRQLARVEEVMRPLDQCRVAAQERTVREILVSQERPGRRTGAVLVIDSLQRLVGIFTDSDLARLLARQQDHLLDQPIRQVMTHSPTCVERGTMMREAIAILTERKISELPVLGPQHEPLGVIDITDVVAFLPPPPNVAGAQPSDECEDEPLIIPWPNRSAENRVHET